MDDVAEKAGARTLLLVVLALVVPLALTLYAWKIATESADQSALAQFEVLADENQDAMQFRMQAYDYALIGATAYFHRNPDFTRAEWRRYVETLDIGSQFPGINGVGVIEPAQPGGEAALEERIRAAGAPEFEVHPDTTDRPLYVITLIEPIEINRQALGLNIGFEDNRVEAANLARDTGQPAITKKIILVQDNEQTPGFLMLRPAYREGAPLDTAEQRAEALRAWIYAPFIARNLLANLTPSQGRTLRLQLYDGGSTAPENLIYDSAGVDAAPPAGEYRVSERIGMMQQDWLAVWTSTPAFDQAHRSDRPLIVLVCGLFVTGLFSLYFFVASVRRPDTVEAALKEKKYLAPALVFLVALTASAYLYVETRNRERDYVAAIVHDRADKIALLMSTSTNDKLLGLRRMGQRWEAAGGTPEPLWRADAANHIDQLPGLRAIEWIDETYHIRWIEPMAGNEAVVGLDILFNEERERALSGAAATDRITITPPLDLRQGYRALIAYSPVRRDGRFAGFMAGIFASEQFFDSILTEEMTENFAISLTHDGADFFSAVPGSGELDPELGVESTIRIADTGWRLSVTPTRRFVDSQTSSLPGLLFFAGLLIAALLALTLRAILISRVKSAYLAESNELNAAILSSSAYLIIAADTEGRIVLFNRAAERALGYSADELVGRQTPAIWHDADEVAERAAELSFELGREIAPGFEVFTAVPREAGVESRRWTYIRKNGERLPVNLSVTPLRNSLGGVAGYLGVAEDISHRLERERALQESEETFRTAMDHAPIGMGLCGPDGRWLKVSPSLCDLFGQDEADMLDNAITTTVHEDDRAELADLLDRAVSGEIASFQTETRYYDPQGRLIWTLVSASLVRDPDGAIKYFIAQIQDITERKEVERLKSEFVSVVSHELRTPLTAIRGSLALIIGTMSGELPAKATRLLDIAHNNCERLILLINDILDIDKIASGKMRFDMKPRSLAELIAQSVDANQAYADRLEVKLKVCAVDPNLRIEVDESRFIQVMSNLLSNAAKFSPTGGRVDIAAIAHSGTARINVVDHGPGIAEEFHSRIFGKFVQADSSSTRAKGGTGLGLNITKQIVEHMDGRIGFDSVSGQGATFWIEFPVCDAKGAAAEDGGLTDGSARSVGVK